MKNQDNANRDILKIFDQLVEKVMMLFRAMITYTFYEAMFKEQFDLLVGPVYQPGIRACNH